jgi:anti-sigma factor RsiW
MMRCPDAKDLQRFADGELKKSESSRIAEHVQGCKRCAKAIERLDRVGVLVAGAIRKETERHDLSGLWEGVREGIASPAPHPGAWERLTVLLWKPAVRVAYAAAIVLIAGIVAVKALLLGPDQPAGMAQATVDRVFSYNPEVTVSVVMSSSDDTAVVWITGLEATKEN